MFFAVAVADALASHCMISRCFIFGRYRGPISGSSVADLRQQGSKVLQLLKKDLQHISGDNFLTPQIMLPRNLSPPPVLLPSSPSSPPVAELPRQTRYRANPLASLTKFVAAAIFL